MTLASLVIEKNFLKVPILLCRKVDQGQDRNTRYHTL